ncbi:MAG: hypothetical protein HFH00_07090 [Dorea sp.]|nr:hypothetical protein [Dorea sp.]
MFKVKDLFSLSSFQGLTVVGGSLGLEKNISDLSVMEVPDIENYVRQGSFLLSTLYPFVSQPEKIPQLIPRLHQAGLSGIGIKLNRYFSSIPSVCIEQADRLGFALLILPDNSDFSIQIHEYLTVCIEKNHIELEHRNFVHEKMMELLLHGDNLQNLANVLSEILHRTILLLDDNYEALALFPADRNLEMIPEILKGRKAMLAASDFFEIQFSEGYVAVYTVLYSSEYSGCIVVYDEKPFSLTRIEIISLEQFAVVFQVIMQHITMAKHQEYKNREVLFCDMVYTNISEPQIAAARGKMLKWDLTFPVSIMLLNGRETTVDSRKRISLMNSLHHAVECEFFSDSSLENTFWVENQSNIAIVLNQTALEKVDAIARYILKLLSSQTKSPFFLTLSRESFQMETIGQCLKDAQYTLKLARKMKRYGITRFRDLGVYRIISSAQNQSDLWDFCSDMLSPLIHYDQKHNSELLETLEALVNNGGNIKNTAAALHVHYNTLRYRYQLIKNIIERDLDDPDTFYDLNLALKIYRIIENV